MIEICPKEDCTGCQACKQVCPTAAISFTEDDYGHIYPKIDKNICIDCNKCNRICPSVHPIKLHPAADSAIACWIKDSEKRKDSTSGGLSYGISKRFVEEGGIFVGVYWDNNINNAAHNLTDSIEGLNLFQGSKYSHSDVQNIYHEIKDLLKMDRKVLFSGTPCQIAGLKAYLNNDYDNLFTIGLVCHGVPSRRVLRDRLVSIEHEFGYKVTDYKSRVKTPDQYRSSSQYTLQNGKKIRFSVFKDLYFRFFVTNYGLRPNCFRCQYARSERIEDLTVADFWGYQPYSLKFRSYLKGTSEVLINTPKGKMLFDMVKKDLIYDIRPIQDAQSCNRNLNTPQEKPKDYNEFWDRYLAGETLADLSPIYFPMIDYKFSPLSRFKTYIKMILPSKIFKR